MYSFGLGAVLSTLLFLALIAGAGNFLNHFMNPFLLNTLNIIVGLLLIGFGIKTAFKKL